LGVDISMTVFASHRIWIFWVRVAQCNTYPKSYHHIMISVTNHYMMNDLQT